VRHDDDDGEEFSGRARERIRSLASDRREARARVASLEGELAALRAGHAAELTSARAEVEEQWRAKLDLGRLGVDDDDGVALVAAAYAALPKEGRPKSAALWWAGVAERAKAGEPPQGLSRALQAYLPPAAPLGHRGAVAPRPPAPPAPHGGEVRGRSTGVEIDPDKGFAELLRRQRLGLVR
jgi:outer membrane murein-binding lipoprotein Lpp